MLLAMRTASPQGHHVNGAGFDPTPVEIPVVAHAAQRPITSMDLVTMRDLHGLALSPDGKSVAFVVGQAVYTTNSYRSGLFVVGTAPGSVPVSLGTAGPPRWSELNEWMDEAPQWSPDSRYIAYRLRTGGAWQIWRWNRDGSDPVQLTHGSRDVQSFRWSPNGRTIMFVARVPVDSGTTQALEERGILYDGRILAGEQRPVVDEVLDFLPDKTEDWVYDVATGTERRPTPSDQVGPPDWRDKLGGPVFDKQTWRNGIESDILYPTLSPDGARVAYSVWQHDARTSPYDDANRLYIKPLDGSRAVEANLGAARLRDYWWTRDGQRLYVTATVERGRSPVLHVVSARGGPARSLTHVPAGTYLDNFSVDDGATHAACTRETNTTPAQVALLDLATGALRTLVDVNPEFHNLTLSPATRIEWTSKYGQPGYGYLVKPLNYESGKRYPLVVTTYVSGDYFLRGGVGDEYPIQRFAAAGFAVLSFDVGRRSADEPGNFEQAMLKWRWPLASLDAALARLDTMGIVDAHRRGLTGLSYGAEITGFTISHSDLFQAAIQSGGGSRDPFFYYMAGAWWHKKFAEWGLGGWPESKSAAARWHVIAPSLNADRINAPLLSNAAETEYIDDLADYTSLEQLGKPMELFIYSKELHIKNQPKHRYEIYERNVDWFKFWLQGIEDPDPTKRDQYERWRGLRKLHDQDVHWSDRVHTS